MHLAGEADARNVVGAQMGGLQRLADRRSAGAPPVAWILLGPTKARAGEGLVLFRSGSDDFPGRVHDERARAAGSYVDSEIRDVPLLDLSSYLLDLMLAGGAFDR